MKKKGGMMDNLSKENAERKCRKQLEEWDKAKEKYEEICSKYATRGTRDPYRDDIQPPNEVSDAKALAGIQQAKRDVDTAEQEYRECVRRLSRGE